MITTLENARRVQSNRVAAGKPGLAAAVSRFLRREYAQEEHQAYLKARQAHRAALQAHYDGLKREPPKHLPHPGRFQFRFTSPRYVEVRRSLLA